MYDVIIVGGGASGMMASIHAALPLFGNVNEKQRRAAYRILLLERMDKLGKKILATGNGKCNYSNIELQPLRYHGTDSSFASRVINRFTVEETILFFRKLGIYPKEKSGWLYPYSEQAASVVAVLQMELNRLGVEVCLSEQVHSVQKQKQGFQVRTEHSIFETKSLILAGGGCASSKLGSNGSNYVIAESFGHTIVPPCPALVQLKCKGDFFKGSSGVRLEAAASMFLNGKLAAREKGELLFTDYGVSGILILQLSSLASRGLRQKEKVDLILDFFPSLSEELLLSILRERLLQGAHKTVGELLIGLLPYKLIGTLLKKMNFSPVLPSRKAGAEFSVNLSKLMKACSLSVIGTNDFEQAQVTSGGVLTDEVESETMESRLQKGLYFVGELLDIDGPCGGYNLQWAWSSGAIAGKAAGGVL